MSIESRFANSPTISALTDRDARQSAYNILETGGIIIMEIGDSGPYGLLDRYHQTIYVGNCVCQTPPTPYIPLP